MAADALPENGGAKLSDNDEFHTSGAPLKYIPLCEVYSATSPRVTASGSKKVKAAARKPPQTNGHGQLTEHPITPESQFAVVYSRRRRRAESTNFMKGLLPESVNAESEVDGRAEGAVMKRRRFRDVEVGSDCKLSGESDAPAPLSDDLDKTNCKIVRENRNVCKIDSSSKTKKQKNDSSETAEKNSGAGRMRRWVRLSFDGVDPEKFIELQCKVYWPLDASWYCAHITGYNSETGQHHLKYEDGEQEELVLSDERIKFYISSKEMQIMELKLCEKSSEADELDANEMMVLAATLDDDCEEIETGDLIWAKLTGHAAWPAIVLDESHVGKHKGLNKISGEKSVIVQFFGTYDFARVPRKQVIQFLKGLLSSCHSKCKKPSFVRGLEEAKVYLSEQRLPESMQQLRDGVEGDVEDNRSRENEDGADSDGESISHDEILKKLDDLKSSKLEDGELQIVSLGKIVRDSSNFQNEKYIWPEGYSAVRKFTSFSDPTVHTMYKMEVLRDVDSRTRPLFKVTGDNGEEFNGPTPSACWNKIYKKIRNVQIRNKDNKADQKFSSGSYMFGFSHPKVFRIIKEMSRSAAKSSLLASRKMKNSSVGYRPVTVTWMDLDKCNVCHMDEEYENNLFLQCDKCRMMVHARCYGELEPSDGVLWLCNLCRPGAPESPLCCLCPVVGGAMKPTTNDSWAHLACAIWIPETCLLDVKKMEPIDGIDRINKDRWKLLCSICHVSHGACIQCSNINCRVSYHPLCARAAGFCLETEDMDRVHTAPLDEDDEYRSIQLLSFCERHRPKSNENVASDKQIVQKATEDEHAEYIPPINPSGCARTEIYDYRKKREKNGQDGPSSKRLYVENVPHIPGGFSHHMPLWNKTSSNEPGSSKHSVDLLELRSLQLKSSREFLSVADKYNHMRETYRRRLAYGKSRIHGFGVFTKLPYKAGDMVIEYTGDIIRGSVADRREHLSYNKLVGAGTYMFRIDDNRVLDATKSGSIAHLINHSCESNCYSRVITVNDQNHIIIFAKRDINYGEELTYDYRFSSIGERLACYCGSSKCRGVVNDVESEERVKKLHVPSSELTDWKGE
ncbi:histone-lysine N-methyltransferase ATX2-like isoform X1 [Salvia hispanica]|uniref:histone-lysine N-methyltransferase ATX2-like isoform X1 n=1 Tax=Salvia hispanica TaxID=49212 RepID=UPI0020094652|nr:histone-lysine N-methyltransferase ATX2-like isoform X1 [Salvia hispanica]